ncbi:MAG: hypothetical protein U0325_01200 [Polyangiales bacterium]
MSRDELPELPDDIAALLRDARDAGPAPSSERRRVAARLAITTGVLIPGAGFAGAKVAAMSWALRTVGVVAVLAGGAVTVGSLRPLPARPTRRPARRRPQRWCRRRPLARGPRCPRPPRRRCPRPSRRRCPRPRRPHPRPRRLCSTPPSTRSSR